jgi:probable phosphoglycerate mutase
MKELWLIRHGESEGNINRWVTGCEDLLLTDNGINQAKALGKWIKASNPAPDLLLSSGMRRAVDTALHMALEIEPVIYPELNETDAGEVSYWLREEFDEQFPEFWDPFDEMRPFPGGESHQQLYERVNECTNRILGSQHDESLVMMVAHAGTISSIMHYAYNVPMKYFSRFVVDNGSVTILRYFDNSSPPQLVMYNQRPPSVLHQLQKSTE